MENGVELLNGELWIFAALVIGVVLVQCFLFVRLALRFNKKNKLFTAKELKSVVKTSGVSIIGPAMNVIFMGVTIVAILGPAFTYMRLGVIGGPMTEFGLAQQAAIAMGIKLGADVLTPEQFTFIIFGNAVLFCPYFITTMILFKPLDAAAGQGVKKKSDKPKKKSFLPSVTGGMAIALITYGILGYLTGVPQIVAFAFAFTASAVINVVAKRKQIKWLFSYNLVISLLLGMITGQVTSMLLAA